MSGPRRPSWWLLGSAVAMLGCGDNASRAPNPTAYKWPDSFAYRLDYVSDAQLGGRAIEHYAETRTMHFQVREEQYIAVSDSVLKTSQRPGEPLHAVPFEPEDTLSFYVTIGKRGELKGVQLGCDPAVRSCAAVMPSSVTLQLRRFIPRLPLWEAPLGSSWEDTLEFDDTSRPGGVRGALLTRYTGRGDTTIGGRDYWILAWRSARTAARPGQRGEPLPVREDGVTLVEKARLVPAFAVWAAVVVPSPEARARGAAGIGYRGRAYLTGSVFDSLYSHEVEH